MKLEGLKIVNFRNYDTLNIEFKNNLNIIYGLNGSGKTNLVEAIYLLALTKSFRLSNDKLLIKHGMEKLTVEGEVRKNNNTNRYKVVLNKDGKTVEINDNKVSKLSDYVSKINIILFSPVDTNLIFSSPSERRILLNIEISQLYKEYLIILGNYGRILKQRNFYLRTLYINGNSSKEYLNILTDKLIEYGLEINKYREKFIENINKYISKIYLNIFNAGEVKVKYVSSFSNKTKDELITLFNKNYAKEMSYGKTIYGIHHDDIVFTLDGFNLKDWGSEGQRKNSVISFKLAELNVIYEKFGYYPILILDDLFSELDHEKINNILSMLNDNVETFITSTEINSINEDIKKKSAIFHVVSGKVEVEKSE